MEDRKITQFLVTGLPGIGKTTLIRKICSRLTDHIKLTGFYTDEVKLNDRRIGFDVITLSGIHGTLAREKPQDNLARPKVGKYFIYTKHFEDLTLPLLNVAPNLEQLLIIDEIGKMELLSNRFEAAINGLIHQKLFVLATIPLHSRKPVIERLKNSPNTVIYQVTKDNRDSLSNEIAEHIIKTMIVTK